MKRKAYQVTSPATLVFVMFLFVIFSANASLSYAASHGKKSQAMERKSAVAHTENQIKLLESALNITDAQKASWNKVTQVMRENAKETDARHEANEKARAQRAEKDKPRSAVERMKAHTENTEAYLAQMKKLLPPFETLYASMSDQQKTITDLLFETGKHKRYGRHGRHGRK
ncbi:MAG: Spy/CpxP family protein refolding chaperone [Smithellaceae bacterium]